jgi:ribosomal protein S12 methylthiotransferase accessory factor
VNVAGTYVGTNGKGLSPEYALASGYAEFLERLQNQALYWRVFISPEAQKKHGFLHDPSEKKYPTKDLPELPKDFMKAHLQTYGKSLYEFWEENKSTMDKRSEERVFVPFYNLRDDKLDYVDIDFFQMAYGSNGMCAGNTPEEAMSQGLSEILERYAIRRIYLEGVTPPTMPDEYIAENAPEQYAIMKDMEQSGNLKIIVKDCSMGQGMPVIAVIVIFNDTNTYTVVFGGEPIWQIALERCLTESLQGRILRQYRPSRPLRFLPDGVGELNLKDYREIFLTGEGQYPDTLFYTESTYPFEPYSDRNIRSQGDKVKYILGVLKALDYNIYMRDVSYLGFNAYWLIIPGMSEVGDSMTIREQLELVENFDHPPIQKVSNLDKLPDEELRQLADHMEKFMALAVRHTSISLSDYLGMPCSEHSPWNTITLNEVLTCIYYKLGDFKKAHERISLYMEGSQREGKGYTTYHAVVKQFLALMCLYPNDFQKIASILVPLNGEQLAVMVLNDFADKDGIFKFIPLPNMWNCETCSVVEHCNYQTIEEIHLALKDKMRENPLDQMRVKELLNQ